MSQAFERLIDKHHLRRIRLHDLRHTHATLALKAGVPVKVISERLGHESPAFTLKQYAHVIPGMQAEPDEVHPEQQEPGSRQLDARLRVAGRPFVAKRAVHEFRRIARDPMRLPGGG